MSEKEQLYFDKLNFSLKKYERDIPYMIVDLDFVDHNINQLRNILNPDVNFRIVVKSLPSIPLINYVMKRMESYSLMVFHQPFLSQIVKDLEKSADILLGKPMPVKTAKYFYDTVSTNVEFNPYTQIQWLVDSSYRVEQYINMARSLKKKLRLNIEIDVGLHRGGFSSLSELRDTLTLINENEDYVIFSGYMGYDPHITKIPKWIRSQKKSIEKSREFYASCISLLRDEFPDLWSDELTFNGAGSPTISLHKETTILNDISAGSCFVMPSSFDIKELNEFVPASFIATPILKKLKEISIPGIERFKGITRSLGLTRGQALFIYGGYWKADLYYPKGLVTNSLYGESTNQSLISVKNSNMLDIDDYIFLRPQQSEFVFLQFGKLLIVRDGNILEKWEILEN